MAILVTGGKGFIGARVVRELVLRGEQVVCFDLKSTPGRLGDLADKVKMIAGDITDYASVYDAMKNNDIDRVAHMVFYSAEERGVSTRSENASGIYHQQMIMNTGTFHVFEAARKLAITRIAYPSSVQYHGGDDPWEGAEPVNEQSPPLPTSSYGIGKYLCEHLAGEYNRLHDTEIITLRVPGAYGPGAQIGARGINLIATEGALGKPVFLPYRHDQHVVLAHVDDIAFAFTEALFIEQMKSPVYHIGGHYTAYSELADIGRQLTPKLDVQCNETVSLRCQYRIDSSLIEKELGLSHRSLLDGFGALAEETRRNAKA